MTTVTLSQQLREAFEDTKSNRVRDWNILLRAADEIERLEKIEQKYRDLQLINDLELEAQGRIIARLMRYGRTGMGAGGRVVRVVIHNDDCGRVPLEGKTLANGDVWYVEKAIGPRLRDEMNVTNAELCGSCKPALSDLMQRVRERSQLGLLPSWPPLHFRQT